MFTLIISICCFWNNQQQGAWREAQGTAVSRAQLGFHDWEAGLDYARLRRRGGRGAGWWEVGGFRFLSFKALSRFLTAGWKKARALGMCASSPSERSLTRVRSVIAGPVTLLTPIQLARAKLTNGFQIHYKINRKVQMWSKTF